jgi:hypothetical protein
MPKPKAILWPIETASVEGDVEFSMALVSCGVNGDQDNRLNGL